jgi:hypothetical protein
MVNGVAAVVRFPHHSVEPINQRALDRQAHSVEQLPIIGA